MKVKATFNNKLFDDLAKSSEKVYATVWVTRVEDDIKFVCGKTEFVIDPWQLYGLIWFLFNYKFAEEVKDPK